jgi:hypothetical protein
VFIQRNAFQGQHFQMANKGWLTPFDDPIVLDDGTVLTTLQQAVEYLAKTVPAAEHNHPDVLTAADHLTRSAEQNYPIVFARMATLQAIHRNKERVFNPDHKDHHWGKRKLKRDQIPALGDRCFVPFEYIRSGTELPKQCGAPHVGNP